MNGHQTLVVLANVQLTMAQARLYTLLFRRGSQGLSCSHRELYEGVYGPVNGAKPDAVRRNVAILIHEMRQKGVDTITTIRGAGYRLEVATND